MKPRNNDRVARACRFLEQNHGRMPYAQFKKEFGSERLQTFLGYLRKHGYVEPGVSGAHGSPVVLTDRGLQRGRGGNVQPLPLPTQPTRLVGASPAKVEGTPSSGRSAAVAALSAYRAALLSDLRRVESALSALGERTLGEAR